MLSAGDPPGGVLLPGCFNAHMISSNFNSLTRTIRTCIIHSRLHKDRVCHIIARFRNICTVLDTLSRYGRKKGNYLNYSRKKGNYLN